jgi:D-alanyl-lipoteichoic acid acyltransferase DltB (MBOAT superfamily)
MELTSLSFVLFFVASLTSYWFLSTRFRPWLLLLVSLLFYFSWKPAFGGTIILISAVTFFASLLMERQPVYKRLIATFSVAFVIGTLFIFKYLGFFGITLNGLSLALGTSYLLPAFEVALPIGLSFYTFQTVGYLIDIYRSKYPAEQNFFKYLLFVTYFPKLIAGPIERGDRLLPQLTKPEELSAKRIVSGLQLFVWGLFKKVVIADNLRLIVDPVFENLPEYRGLSLVITVFFYSWQIYADFSGYTDMARGISRMLGIELLENFRQPYLASSVGDFWRRWHMSLSSWLREYVYFPLGGSRAGFVRTSLNLMVVFLLCGLWHGAGWTFVLWGAFHGIVLVWERIAKIVSSERVRIPNIVGMLYTYTLVCISWVLFRANSLNDAFYIYRNSLVGLPNFISPSYIQATFSQVFETNQLEIAIALFAVGCIVTMDQVERRTSLKTKFHSLPTLGRFSLYVLAVVVVLLLRNVEYTPFVYVQF